jgi:hypothetical protein
MAEIAKKFTFYRVRDAPSKSGIKKGKSDNGLTTAWNSLRHHMPAGR